MPGSVRGQTAKRGGKCRRSIRTGTTRPRCVNRYRWEPEIAPHFRDAVISGSVRGATYPCCRIRQTGRSGIGHSDGRRPYGGVSAAIGEVEVAGAVWVNQEEIQVVRTNRRTESQRHSHCGNSAGHAAHHHCVVLNRSGVRNTESTAVKSLASSLRGEHNQAEKCEREGPLKVTAECVHKGAFFFGELMCR
jgi:hypothetical protein